jgi:hypothetical protein
MKAQLSEGYKPEWDVDLAFGKKGERYVADFLGGLLLEEPGRITAETKADRQWVNTGNIWIELECKRRDGWHDSGIRTSRADMYTLVLGECIVLGVPTRILRQLAEYANAQADSYGKWLFRSEHKEGSHPTRGVRIGLPWFLLRLRVELMHDEKAVA